MLSFDAPWRREILLAVVALCLCGCRGGAAWLPVEESPVSIQPVGSGFDAVYSEPVVKLPAAYGDPRLDLPIDLGLVVNLDHWGFEFSADQLDALSADGFFATATEVEEFDLLYGLTADSSIPLFITVDSLQHVYHLVFNKLLREMEESRFTPLLIEMTSALEDEAGLLFAEVEGTSLEDTARRAWAYFAVAEQLIMEEPPQIAAPIAELVEGEVALIEAHSGFSPSPVLSFEEPLNEDYSQYIVRGHYTRTTQRQRYFRTMMWYGRLNARLKSPPETQVALLITWLSQKALAGERPVMELWASIYDPTAFLVGNADDLGPREYSDVMRQVYGDTVTVDQLADPDLLTAFIAAARELPAPLINSMLVFEGEDEAEATQGFRFMGQRFVLDGYMIGQLTNENVIDRFVPSGLDVLASMGSGEAYLVLDEIGATSYQNYDSQLTMLKDFVGVMAVEDWTATLYASWLYSMEGLIQPKGDVFPPFMRTQPWARKELNGALGSWAELKHDTILYAKQPYAACPSVPPHSDSMWVEPNPLAFARLLGLVTLTRSGLSSSEVLDLDIEDLLEMLSVTLEHCQLAAELELAGDPLTEDLFSALLYYDGWLKTITGLTADRLEGQDPAVEPAAIIADVFTDAYRGQVLEVGTGTIDALYVVIPRGVDELQVARGGVFSYYEFMWPMADRLTDEAWRAQFRNDEQPDRPAWTGMYTVE